MSQDLQSWALPRIQRLLPLDDESLKEVIAYTTSLSKADGAEHLKNLLGDSAQALEFISSFNSRRSEVTKPTQSETRSTPVASDAEGVPRSGRRGPKKAKPPLHSAGPVRQPAGYGDVSGGYVKRQDHEDYVNRFSKTSTPTQPPIPSLTQTPDALQAPTVTRNLKTPSPTGSRNASPSPRQPSKLPPSAAGSLISDLNLPNIRSKQSKKIHPSQSQPQSGTSTPHRTTATTTTSSVNDLTAAIAALELSTNPSLSTERRKCICNASIHPLFETAPNCLNCGKIICALEGLQPCSFCDVPILSKDQVNSMIRALKEERGVEKMAVHNAAAVSGSGRGTPIFGAVTPENLSGDEVSAAAVRAREHRDKLLSFQRENARRTRIYDEAADYDATLTPGTTQWMSPVQRAAALKRQQKYLREMEDANRPEWEKKRTVMSVSIQNGKLVKRFEKVQAPSSANTEEAEEDHADIDGPHDTSQNLSSHGTGAFSKNPLLVSGKLIRPIWKAADGQTKGKGKDEGAEKSARTRPSVWRRVQDDDNDNEQWILDGGLHGFGTETRLMEDGSQQECG